MTSQDVEHLLSIFDPATTGDMHAEHDLLAGVVRRGLKGERSAHDDIVNSPSSQTAGHFLNVSLRIPAVNAERVQLHQLARVVLIEAGAAALHAVHERRIAQRRMRTPALLDAPL